MSDTTVDDTTSPDMVDTLDESTAAEPSDRRAARFGLRLIGEIILGVALGALILWVLIVSVNDVQFVYQGF